MISGGPWGTLEIMCSHFGRAKDGAGIWAPCQAHSSASFDAGVTARQPVVHRPQCLGFLLFRKWFSELSVLSELLGALVNQWLLGSTPRGSDFKSSVWGPQESWHHCQVLRDATKASHALSTRERGWLYVSHWRRMLLTPPLYIKLCVHCECRCPWSSEEDAGSMGDANSSPHYVLLIAEPSPLFFSILNIFP